MLISLLLALVVRPTWSYPIVQFDGYHIHQGTGLIVCLEDRTARTPPRSTADEKLVVVDLTAHRLYAYQGSKEVMRLKVSAGRPGLDTPIGVVKVQRKDLNGTSIHGEPLQYLIRVYVYDPRMKMYRRINIHEYKSVPDKNASSGCVRTKIGEGRKLYEWIEVGTPVHFVSNSASDCLL